MNKFVNLWSSGGREGILKMQPTIPSEDPRGVFTSFGMQTTGEGYIFESPPSRGWIQDTDFLIDLNSTNNYTASDSSGKTWLSVEYMINKSTNHTEMWVYDNAGLVQNIAVTRSDWDSGNFNGLQLGGYWNAYVTANVDAYILIDNLEIRSSYIGPPAGFVGGGDTTPPTVTAFTITPTTSTSLTVPIATFTATDSVGVTGYCLTETSTPPTSGTCTGSGWSATAQASYVFTTDGSKQLWAWAKDAAGNISTNIISDTILVDTTLPTILSVNSDKANGSYKAGDVIDIDVTFSETVSVTGYVVVTLDTGGSCQFSLPSGSSGTCNYTVLAGHTSSDLNVTNISGTIADLVGNAMTNFAPATNLSTNKALVIDTTVPTVLNVTSDVANAIYRTGQVIDIDVTFSETVTSTGNVTVTLETGATDRTCTFTVTSGTTGTCNYTVQEGDFSGDLTVNSVSGTIADVAGNLLSNTTPVTNLAANKNLVINPSVPYIGGATGIGVSIR